jgi:uncharacterized protein YciU (UPF0263 family)
MSPAQQPNPKNGKRGAPTARRVEFYAQFNGAISIRRSDVLTFLDRLESDGRIGSYETDIWPSRVCLSDDHPRHRSGVVDLFERFEEWAETVGVSIRPAFEVSTTTSIADEETEPVLKTPAMCLAIYDGPELRGVFPCSKGTENYDLSDGLRMLAAAEPLPFGAETEDTGHSQTEKPPL